MLVTKNRKCVTDTSKTNIVQVLRPNPGQKVVHVGGHVPRCFKSKHIFVSDGDVTNTSKELGAVFWPKAFKIGSNIMSKRDLKVERKQKLRGSTFKQ